VIKAQALSMMLKAWAFAALLIIWLVILVGWLFWLVIPK
jgi:hypothetical protein